METLPCTTYGNGVDCPFQVLLTPSSGYGVFATRPIRRGSLIAVEPALIAIPHVPDGESVPAFCDALKETSEDKLSLIDKHSCDAQTLEVVRRSRLRREILAWHRQDAGTCDGVEEDLSEDLQARIDETCRRYATFLNNNLSLGYHKGRGLFPLFSRMNHSCTPNIHEYYSPDDQKLYIRTTSNVKAGEQLCSIYISALLPLRQRQKALSRWEFVCACHACLDPELETMRERAIFLDDSLEEYFWYADEASDLREEDEGPSLASAGAAVAAAEQLVGLLEKLELNGEPLFNAYRAYSRLSYEAGDIAQALGCANKAQEIEICCVGDSASLTDAWESTSTWMKKLQRLQASKGTTT